MWLLDNDHKVWHLWEGLPVEGDKALCGKVKSASCTVPGDGVSVKKCAHCVANRVNP